MILFSIIKQMPKEFENEPLITFNIPSCILIFQLILNTGKKKCKYVNSPSFSLSLYLYWFALNFVQFCIDKLIFTKSEGLD